MRENAATTAVGPQTGVHHLRGRVNTENVKELVFKTGFVRTSVVMARLSFVECPLNQRQGALCDRVSNRQNEPDNENIRTKKEKKKKG